MRRSQEIIRKTEKYGAANYHPLPVVIAHGEGVWVRDVSGKRYMDMLSGYSALNQGHRHPKIIQALKEQADKVTLTSRAFHNERMGDLLELLGAITGKEAFLPMNTGAEAVETAMKMARRWAYQVKGVPEDEAEIIVCEGNFHGRTIAATSCSSSPEYRHQFGPFTPGFRVIPYGDSAALEQAISSRTAAFLVEPIQGEAGIRIPREGYLKECAACCRDRRVLLMADEIQTGLGRTGQWFASDWEDVVPDAYIIGKALGGGVMPISGVAADRDLMQVFEPGSHGSTFGGNPLACAVAIASLKVLHEENLPQRSRELGEYMLAKLRAEVHAPCVLDIRGRGLFIGIELAGEARTYSERLMNLGLLTKETHHTILRLAPPLIITEEQIDWAVSKVKAVLP
ncbi:ornithine--oxo-acid transaminase [Paenibacillus doosanensis]|uniref:ornithine aminotransferase n=1 Tax=Paenibacillus konkukensis TaxID=2020716 RepID=A0ABY4S0X5_9BACL|nr:MULTISPECIES: ornithine--oxo-acid transaminase [Paenibacillus]MCS7460429.1 ornithine--oxo-acid transaminase [Paenibacillus doosanensis]UQZ87454.1 Ornithine aminotransferase [Paenibacillus konkukensis]